MKKIFSLFSLLLLSGCGYMSDAELDEKLKDRWGITYEQLQDINDGKIDIHDNKISYGTMTDDAGNSYKTVIIGNQEWMAENFKFANGVTCYANTDADSNFVENYGCLYTWDDAKKVCPSGWRLPIKPDFDNLLTYVGKNRTASSDFLALIKKSTDWTSYSNQGLDEFGFGGLPAGYYDSGCYDYDLFGYYGYWWSATEDDSSDAYGLILGDVDANVNYKDHKTFGFSVRCLRDSN